MIQHIMNAFQMFPNTRGISILLKAWLLSLTVSREEMCRFRLSLIRQTGYLSSGTPSSLTVVLSPYSPLGRHGSPDSQNIPRECPFPNAISNIIRSPRAARGVERMDGGRGSYTLFAIASDYSSKGSGRTQPQIHRVYENVGLPPKHECPYSLQLSAKKRIEL